MINVVALERFAGAIKTLVPDFDMDAKGIQEEIQARGVEDFALNAGGEVAELVEFAELLGRLRGEGGRG